VIGEHSLAQSNIMVVDDNPDDLKVLEDMLRQEGYEVRSFPRGRLALTAAMRNPPKRFQASPSFFSAHWTKPKTR